MIMLLVIMEFITWIIVHFLCEFKYYWCKGNCESCHNWKCKYFRYD